jgi:hypothetical protein
MKKNLATLITMIFVILVTGTFTYAESVMVANAGEFPYFHLGTLIVGGLIITSLQQKYNKIRLSESVGSFALYAILIALFTNPVIELIKNLVG